MSSRKAIKHAADNSTTAAQQARRAELKTSPHLPPEILQKIFRNLRFFDLIRCQRVCKSWNAYLPGDDPKLNRTLFYKAKLTSDKEVPTIIVKLKAPVDEIQAKGKLPRLAFGIEVAFHGLDEDGDFNDDLEFHPMVEDLEYFMHFVHPDFTAPDPLKKRDWWRTSKYKFSIPTFAFKTFEELEEKLYLPEDYEHDDGSWEDKLMCVPAVKNVDVQFEWPFEDYTRLYHIENEGRERATVGQFIEAVRVMLTDVEEDVRGFAGEMCVVCQDCYELNG